MAISNDVKVNISRNTQRSANGVSHSLVAGQFIVTPLIEDVTAEMRILILYPYFNARYYALYVDGVILNSSMVAPMGQALVTSSALFSDLSRLGIGLFLQESYQTPVTILNLEQTEASLRAVQGQLIKEEN